jgi:hypothetical protein
MAMLTPKRFHNIAKERNTIHVPVEATYTTFEKMGEKYFQIDTYGSDEREIPGKASQSIQIDEMMAKILIEKLEETFQLKK